MDGQNFAIDAEHNGADAPKRGAAASAQPVVEAKAAGGRQNRPRFGSGDMAGGRFNGERVVMHTALRLAHRDVLANGFNAHACNNPDRAVSFPACDDDDDDDMS